MNIIEEIAKAFWDAPKDGKMIATIPWEKIPEEWKTDYRLRAQNILEKLKELKEITL
jgi:hypothetical protein